ncbi:MAG: hypothetical protein KDA42_19980, partial [Planctomycetales bacterium]|nr:hypothetical protein [Planctomycetales bacterium]
MFQAWRLQLQEARVALRGGSLDEAGQLLQQNDLLRFRPAKDLSAKLAEKYLERAEDRVGRGESSAGWRDLQLATDLASASPRVGEVRQRLIERSLAEARRYLEAHQPDEALARLERLSQRNASSDESRRLCQAALQWKRAIRLGQRGHFAEAEIEWASAAALADDVAAFAQQLEACRLKKIEAARCTQQLHRALVAEDWSTVLEATDKLLELAPDHPQARSAKCRAWAAVGVRETRLTPGTPLSRAKR